MIEENAKYLCKSCGVTHPAIAAVHCTMCGHSEPVPPSTDWHYENCTWAISVARRYVAEQAGALSLFKKVMVASNGYTVMECKLCAKRIAGNDDPADVVITEPLVLTLLLSYEYDFRDIAWKADRHIKEHRDWKLEY